MSQKRDMGQPSVVTALLQSVTARPDPAKPYNVGAGFLPFWMKMYPHSAWEDGYGE
jgi:hypothetical protein